MSVLGGWSEAGTKEGMNVLSAPGVKYSQLFTPSTKEDRNVRSGPGIRYFFLLVKPPSYTFGLSPVDETNMDRAPETDDTPLLMRRDAGTALLENFKHKLKLIVPLRKFMVPLGIVFFAEYFINQGLQELIYFEGIWLPVVQQYRWYQVIYQLGVLISRSSINCIQIKKLWIFPILQMLNVLILLLQIFYQFLPSIWLVFIIILFEGLLGGAAYVNMFYSITEEVKEQHREFSMGVASMADTMGISIAGAVAIPVHNFICTL